MSRKPAGDSPRTLSTATPIAQPAATASVTGQLRAGVLTGELAPGSRLFEVELSRRFGVSRTPVRAALQALAADGLLEYAPHRGYSVRRFDLEETMQAYEIRATLEGLAARRAAQFGMADADRRAVEAALVAGDRMLARGNLKPEDRIAYGEINFAIHQAISNAARSRMLGQMLRLAQQVTPSSYRNVIAFEYDDVRRRHDDHHRVYEAILCRDGARAELLMREHVDRIRLALMRTSLVAGDAAGSSAAPVRRAVRAPRAAAG